MGIKEQTEHSPRAILAIDPGRAKCGVAVVDIAGQVLDRRIVSLDSVGAAAAELAARYSPERIVLGGATAAKLVEQELHAACMQMPIERVDERHTSEEARAIYLVDHPARGFQKLIPGSLRVPDQPYDDYVAVILGRRWWVGQGKVTG
jgi:RNase H-fold protein (predicted Holliday junction resolvase)